LVLTGLSMPNMNGHDMIREIKKVNPDAEVLIFSSHTDSLTLLSCIHLGISDFISKPADINKMSIIFLKVLLNMKRKNTILNQIKLKNEKNEEVLSFLYENSMSLDIVNYYKGLVFKSAAFIQEINKESITLKVNNLQLLACKSEKKAVLDSSLIGENILCSLINVKEGEYELLLKKEEFFYPLLKNTKDIMLETSKEVKAYIKTKKDLFCTIKEISKKELFFVCNKQDLDIKEHDEIEVFVFLNNSENDTYKRIKGIVFKVEKEDEIQKVLLLIKKDKSVEAYLEKYICRRELFLLNEFKDTFLL